MSQGTESKTKRVLFVCWGNTCRSPMAVGLATNLLGTLGAFESAGISPGDSQANPKAIEVMREMGIDIGTHCPREVSSMSLSDFDFIIAMDASVNAELKRLSPGQPYNILAWDIEDPYGREVNDYRRCAEAIKNKLSDLRNLLQKKP